MERIDDGKRRKKSTSLDFFFFIVLRVSQKAAARLRCSRISDDCFSLARFQPRAGAAEQSLGGRHLEKARGRNPKLDFHRARPAAGGRSAFALLFRRLDLDKHSKHLNNQTHPPPVPSLPPALPSTPLSFTPPHVQQPTATSASTSRTPARPPSPCARWSSPRPRPTSRPSSARSA